MGAVIVSSRELARAQGRVALLKGRCDSLRRRLANPQEAARALVEVDRIELRIGELLRDIRAYHRLMVGANAVLQPITLLDIPQMFIERRIAAGLSQIDLAKRSGMTRQTIARYEKSRYVTITLKRMVQVDFVLRQAESERAASRT